MSLVDSRLLKTLRLPRNSLSASVSADWNVHKYKLSLIPDRKRYDVTVSMERDGVTVFLSQPNQVKYFPTWTSGHCEYIKGRDHPGDGRFNCNGKAVLSGLTRELTVNAE